MALGFSGFYFQLALSILLLPSRVFTAGCDNCAEDCSPLLCEDGYGNVTRRIGKDGPEEVDDQGPSRLGRSVPAWFPPTPLRPTVDSRTIGSRRGRKLPKGSWLASIPLPGRNTGPKTGGGPQKYLASGPRLNVPNESDLRRPALLRILEPDSKPDESGSSTPVDVARPEGDTTDISSRKDSSEKPGSPRILEPELSQEGPGADENDDSKRMESQVVDPQRGVTPVYHELRNDMPEEHATITGDTVPASSDGTQVLPETTTTGVVKNDSNRKTSDEDSTVFRAEDAGPTTPADEDRYLLEEKLLSDTALGPARNASRRIPGIRFQELTASSPGTAIVSQNRKPPIANKQNQSWGSLRNGNWNLRPAQNNRNPKPRQQQKQQQPYFFGVQGGYYRRPNNGGWMTVGKNVNMQGQGQVRQPSLAVGGPAQVSGQRQGVKVNRRPQNQQQQAAPHTTNIRINKRPGARSAKYCKIYEKLTIEYRRESVTGPDGLTVLKTKAKQICPPSFTPLIVGGIDVLNGEFPHMAAIGFNRSEEIDYLCGGSLISPQFVLTAAHCAITRWGPPVVVFLGSWELYSKSGTVARIVDVVSHEGYSPPSCYHDIALLKISPKSLKLSPLLRPACLPSANTKSQYPGGVTVATGWGKLGFGRESTPNLKKVTLKVMDNQKCEEYYASDVRTSSLSKGITSNLLCAAGHLDKLHDTCQGDSGGPLQSVKAGSGCMYEVVGVTSFGKSCGAGVPGVYTKVLPYLAWIENIVWPS